MRLLLLISCLLAGLAAPAGAQPTGVVPPRVPAAQPPAAYYVGQVVDARARQTTAGRVLRYVEVQPGNWRQDLPWTFRDFYDSYAPGQPNATPLLLRVRAFSLTESPLATVSLVADFYVRRPDGSYRRLAYVAHRQQARPAFLTPAASQQPDNVGDLLLGSLLLARNPKSWLADSTHYPAAYVLAPAPHPAEELPVLAADWQPRPGIYHTVEEFWHNAPSEPGRPEITARPYRTTEWAADSQLALARRLPNGQVEPVVGAWGFSDGRRFYLLHGHEYHPLARRGAGFVFYGMVGDDPAYQAAAYSQSMKQAAMVGLVGAAAAASQTTMPSKYKRVLFSFDPITATAGLDGATLAPPPAPLPTQLYLYRPRAAKGPAVRISLAGTGPPRELAAGDYLSFDVPAGQPVQLCAEAAGAAPYCLPLTPAASVTTYVEYRPGPAATLLLQPAKAGAAALERLAR